jgi:hypothetical protein
MSENRRKTKTNNLIIDMHTNKVMGKQAMITETRELVQLMNPNDPMQPAQIQRLLALNEELREALNKLEKAQRDVIDRELVDVDKRVVSSVQKYYNNYHSTTVSHSFVEPQEQRYK